MFQNFILRQMTSILYTSYFNVLLHNIWNTMYMYNVTRCSNGHVSETVSGYQKAEFKNWTEVKRPWLESHESQFSNTVAFTHSVAGFLGKPLPTTQPGQLNGCAVRWYDPDLWATITPREPCSVIACTARYMLQMEVAGQPARLKHAVTLWAVRSNAVQSQSVAV